MILVIIIVLFILFYFINKICIYDYFDNETQYLYEMSLPQQFKDSYCSLNKDNNKCECNTQVSSAYSLFKLYPTLCSKKCNELSHDECVKETNAPPYYCNVAGKCTKYNGVINDTNIMSNNCGRDLAGNLMAPFINEEDCERLMDPCDKYNDLQLSNAERKSNCLKDVQCGYCTNSVGEGKCINATPSGPIDLNKYYYCVPTANKITNSFEYGDHTLFLY